jgi:hypothetical protein
MPIVVEFDLPLLILGFEITDGRFAPSRSWSLRFLRCRAQNPGGPVVTKTFDFGSCNSLFFEINSLIRRKNSLFRFAGNLALSD